jgi:hypothetical protein
MLAPVRPLLLLSAPLPVLPTTSPLVLPWRAELMTWMPFCWGKRKAKKQECFGVDVDAHNVHNVCVHACVHPLCAVIGGSFEHAQGWCVCAAQL